MVRNELTERTDAKLRYAKLHLRELRECDIPGQGHDFERAHLEAFFAQLFGAYGSLFQELNKELNCGLRPEDVSLGKMRKAMQATGPVSAKLTELHEMEQDAATWLSQAKTMRDHVSHVGGIPLTFYQGGPNHGATSFKNPRTSVEISGHYMDHIAKWVDEMEALIQRMRK